MTRRDFITLFGGAATGWLLVARAQSTDRVRRIGILMNLTADDEDSMSRVTAFVQGLQELGWSIGRNLQIDYRWGAGDANRIRRYAAELVALTPDVIVSTGGSGTGPLEQLTRTVPIVFVNTPDPVGAGFVESLSRPGGNATGFTNFEYGASGKWLELLKDVAPGVTRVGVLRDPRNPSGVGELGAIQSVAAPLGVEVKPLDIRDVSEMERALSEFAQGANAGLIVLTSTFAIGHRDAIISVAARQRLPAVYPFRLFATAGGLLAYGPNIVDQYRRAAGYVDRILKGEKPADLPVQAPTKYETVVNLKTAKALGLTIPQTLLATADEVIE